MDWFLFFLNTSPALVVIIGGLIWKKYPPKKINYLYGYRTSRSMKNQQTWDYANQIGPDMIIKTGFFLFLVAALSFWLYDTKTAVIISVIAMVVGLTLGIVICEMKLAQRFDKKGNPKA